MAVRDSRIHADAVLDPDERESTDTDDFVAVLRSAPATDGCPFVSITLR